MAAATASDATETKVTSLKRKLSNVETIQTISITISENNAKRVRHVEQETQDDKQRDVDLRETAAPLLPKTTTATTTPAPDSRPLFFYGHHRNRAGTHIYSQLWPCTFKDPDENVYICTEQYMMAKKALLFNDKLVHDAIMKSKSAKDQKQLGRKVRGFDETVWSNHRLDIVTEGNWLKFSQNKAFGDLLCSTGDRLLVEAAPHDKIWGIGMNEHQAKRVHQSEWPGLNLLGVALGRTRSRLLMSSSSTTTTAITTTTTTK